MAEMLREGVELMLTGMTVVFSLLILLVFALKAMSNLALSIHGPVPSETRGAVPSVAGDGDGDGDEIVAAITAGVHAYRKGKR